MDFFMSIAWTAKVDLCSGFQCFNDYEPLMKALVNSTIKHVDHQKNHK